MNWLNFVSGQGVRVLWFLSDLGKVLVGKVAWRKGVFMDHVKRVQEREGCMDRVLKDFFFYYQI